MDEVLINRIRGALGLGMSLDEIVRHFVDTPMNLVFLAYHAAIILENDINV